MHTRHHVLSFILLAAAVAGQQVVDFHDSTIGSIVGNYPIYTGSVGNTVRGQTLCPSTFAGLPSAPGLVRRIGTQISDQQAYSVFVVRCGVTSVATLTSSWNTNLPDQRVQADLSGTVIQGGLNGTTPVNQWVEWDLRYPFYWAPGMGLILDITAKSAVANVYCRTASATGSFRATSSNYTPTTAALVSSGSGLKMRLYFEPLAVVSFGAGCAGSGSYVPKLGSTGASTLGSLNYFLTLSNCLGGAATVLMLGDSSTAMGPTPLPLPFGGGCSLLQSAEISLGATAGGAGAGGGTLAIPLLIPNTASLLTYVLNAQYLQLDPASLAIVPVSSSQGGKVVVY